MFIVIIFQQGKTSKLDMTLLYKFLTPNMIQLEASYKRLNLQVTFEQCIDFSRIILSFSNPEFMVSKTLSCTALIPCSEHPINSQYPQAPNLGLITHPDGFIVTCICLNGVFESNRVNVAMTVNSPDMFSSMQKHFQEEAYSLICPRYEEFFDLMNIQFARRDCRNDQLMLQVRIFGRYPLL